MQDDLFGSDAPVPGHPPSRRTTNHKATVLAAPPTDALLALASTVPRSLRLGVSTWSYPGWDGLVWDGVYDASVLSRKGLEALSQHPLMRTVCVDRTFWRPLTVEQYAQMAAQVPHDFRFVVKCPNVITDATVRNEQGQGQARNPAFLNAAMAIAQFVHPTLQGLGDKLGVLVYQMSPMPWEVLKHPTRLLAQMAQVLAATQEALHSHPQVIVAVECRDPVLLSDPLIDTLRSYGATLCLGLHGKMPPIEEQLPWLRQLWPTPLVCRWNLNRIFGPFGYPQAQDKHQPFDTVRTPDAHTRTVLAKTIVGITGARQPAFVTISNDAEGCAPRSIALLVEAIQLRSKDVGSAA
jgi:uncharacterized protein YecE (DUF72 family)